MRVTPLDLAVFAAFYAIVLAFSLLKSRGEKDTSDRTVRRRGRDIGDNVSQ